MRIKEYIINGVFYLAYNGLNLLFPFVFSLFITRNLQTEYFGEWILLQTLGLYMYLLADYSFSFSGTKKMFQLKSESERLEYYNLITRFKLSIYIFVSIFFFIYMRFVLQETFLIFGILLIGGVSNLINPSWLLHVQGKTKMIMLINALYKVPVLLLLFFFTLKTY
jgi:O-antigen/teichoic acid export membrane protein